MSWKNAISEFVPPSPRNVGSSFGRRSRLQQQLQQLRRQKTKLQALREQRERDFCLYFNIPDPRHIRGPTSAKRRPAIQSPASTAIRSVSAPSVDRARKAWTTRKKCEIRAESGEVFSFTPADYSSDDLGTDDENADGNDSTVSGPDDNCAHTDGQNMAYDRGSDDAETASEKGFYSCLSETSTSSATRLSFPSLPFSLHLLEYLQIEVFSNWGDNDLVGISHLKLCLEAAETSLVPIVEVQLYRSSRLDSDPASQKIANATEEPHLFCTQNTLPLTVRVLFDISRTPSEARYAVIKIGNYYGTSRFAAGVRECRLMAITSQAQTHVLFEGELQKACEHSEAVDSNCFRFSLQNEAEEPFRMAKCVGELATNVLQCLEEACEFSFAPSPSLSPGSPIWHSSAESGRQRFDAIEMSWGSLELFNRLQAGRLAVNAQLNSLPGIDESLSIVRDSLEDTASVDGSETSVEIDGKPDTYFINDPAAGNEGETTDEDFSIPELPVGNELLLDILSTWGDPHYVGLTSIQVFTADGLEISRECRISAYPPDINILPQFSSDPRVAVNLIDGVNETQDRTHMWLIPFTPGGHHWLRLVLPENAEPIAMIRIWNYNESRVHSSRGARDIKIFLDRKCIFRGQISRSSGLERGKPQEFGETILFTTDEAVLQRIAEHDQAFLRDIEEEEEEEDDDLNHMVVSEGLSDGESAATDAEGVKTRWLDLRLLNAWDGGKCGCIGIAGIKLLADPDGRKEARVWLTCQIDPPVSQFWVDPNTLTDGLNHTTDENHMWTAKFTESVGLQLRFWLIPPDIDLVVEEQEVVDPPTLYGIRLWNYNAPKQCGRASGVKFFQILDDRGRCLGNLFGQEGPFLLKPGPGHLKYDFSQQFLFADLSGTTWNYFPDSIFVLEISLLSNWGDEERIGLSGLQLLGCRSEILPIQPEQVYLHPGVVSELDLLWSNGDVWNPKRLVRTTVAGGDCPSSWSMPINPRGPNQIFVVFDRPVRLVGARIWNYCNRGETSMGARDISIRLDDQLVFAGTLPEYETASPNKPILIGWDTKRKPIANRRAQDTYICTA
ncbi:unnamed protein product [Schistocephalus solidus]|uniref:DUF4457 domain-containing protein n=2 Tax=Schistocephalus solidus TaxID=70667 RepID=A0A183TE39_SCHSO|nr:unnamed protein product [Schistocephalus solidus]